MNRADIFKIFDVELNITIFLGALVATFIYFISYMNNVNELITLCLTLAFPAYLLKISRSFEVILLEEKIKGSVAKLKLYAHLYKTIKANIVLTSKEFC
jgi:hypothetical protein